MKRKRLDRDIWTSIKSKKYVQKDISTECFCGIISLLHLYEVEPVSKWHALYDEITVCEAGMKWLQFLPKNEHYLMTAMVNADNKIVAIYVDVIDGYGKCDDGVYFYDDLYLDLIFFPDGKILLDDRNELNEAYDKKIITKSQYDIAEQTQSKQLKNDFESLNKFCLDYLAYVEKIDK